MPINRGSHLSALIEEVKHLNPQSILDVGCGFGLNGAIFRAYTDIRWSEVYPERYKDWQTRIDAIEIFENYRNPLWKVYDRVVVGDAQYHFGMDDQLLPQYDLIYCGDMIEHFEKPAAHQLIRKMLDHGKYVIIATPSPTPPQAPVLGNAHEEHLSEWDEKDFMEYNHERIGNFGGILMMKLWKK